MFSRSTGREPGGIVLGWHCVRLTLCYFGFVSNTEEADLGSVCEQTEILRWEARATTLCH